MAKTKKGRKEVPDPLPRRVSGKTRPDDVRKRSSTPSTTAPSESGSSSKNFVYTTPTGRTTGGLVSPTLSSQGKEDPKKKDQSSKRDDQKKGERERKSALRRPSGKDMEKDARVLALEDKKQKESTKKGEESKHKDKESKHKDKESKRRRRTSQERRRMARS